MEGSHIDQVTKEIKYPLEMPRGPITRGWSKKFKEALQSLMTKYQKRVGILEDQSGGCFNVIKVGKYQ